LYFLNFFLYRGPVLDFLVKDVIHKIAARFVPAFLPEADIHGIEGKADIYNIETGPKVIEDGFSAARELILYLAPDLGKSNSRVGEYNSRVGEYNSRVGEYNSRVGEYNSRVGKYNPRAGKYNSRVGKYGPRADSISVSKITVGGDR
jgi:hypothetical protein